MKITRRQLKKIIEEELNLVQESEDKADLFSRSIGKKVMGSGYPGATIAGPPLMDPDGKLLVPVKTSGPEPDFVPIEKLTIDDADVDASYDTDQYIPSLERAIAPLRGIANELQSASWGDQTETIHREIKDGLSSLELVLAALKEAQVEYQRGPFGGKLRKRSDTYDETTGTFKKS